MLHNKEKNCLKVTMPPPVKNFLTLSQVAQLQQALKESELSHVRERILIILLQNDGRTQKDISKFLGCSPRTVAYWCMHGEPDNLETLHNRPVRNIICAKKNGRTEF